MPQFANCDQLTSGIGAELADHGREDTKVCSAMVLTALVNEVAH